MGAMLFKYREPEWYGFGVSVGVQNLLKNGTTLGAKKTLGKILQPINSYTRFPEYAFFGDAIRAHASARSSSAPLRILDVGSPKLFGLQLAHRMDVDIHLTDVSRLNLDEYRVLWKAIAGHAKGRPTFELQDARQLDAPDNHFDVVYSMSVLEHIEPELREPRAVGELLRVLKPGGRLIISVPMGGTHVEQMTANFTYEADGAASDAGMHFFQRIFDRHSVRRYIVDSVVPYVEDLQMRTVSRRSQAFGGLPLGENLEGLLGFTNPVWSLLYNRHQPGLEDIGSGHYGAVRSRADVYGDLLLSCRKRS